MGRGVALGRGRVAVGTGEGVAVGAGVGVVDVIEPRPIDRGEAHRARLATGINLGAGKIDARGHDVVVRHERARALLPAQIILTMPRLPPFLTASFFPS